MRRTALLVLVMALSAVAVATLGSSGSNRGGRLVGHEPVHAARRAHGLALASPLVVTLVTSGGTVVARARLDGGRVEVAAALSGVQEGDRLHALGTTVAVPAASPAELLAPLAERPARWEGRHLRLEGSPPAQAWLDDRGGLVSLEIDLGGGSLLVVTPVT